MKNDERIKALKDRRMFLETFQPSWGKGINFGDAVLARRRKLHNSYQQKIDRVNAEIEELSRQK